MKKSNQYSQKNLLVLGSTFPNIIISSEEKTDDLSEVTTLRKEPEYFSHRFRAFDDDGVRYLDEDSRRSGGFRTFEEPHRVRSISDRALSRGVRSERLSSLIAKRLESMPAITKTQKSLRIIDYYTTRGLRDFLGEAYDYDNYSDNIWDKIRETRIDLAWVANLYRNRVEMKDFCKFMIPVKLLNGAVYCMDEVMENKSNGRSHILEAFRKRGMMITEAQRFMNNHDKRELVGMISPIMNAVDVNYIQESFKEISMNEKNLELKLKQAGPVYEEFLEPSELEYLDTGSYGNIFSHWNKIRDRENFNKIWNNSRRASDIIDGLVDVNDDVDNGSICPLTVYTWNKCNGEEKETIEEAFSQRINTTKVRRILQKYSHDLLERNKKYVSKITPSVKNVKMLKHRTLEIIDYGIGMTNDLYHSTKQYNNFYNHSLDRSNFLNLID